MAGIDENKGSGMMTGSKMRIKWQDRVVEKVKEVTTKENLAVEPVPEKKSFFKKLLNIFKWQD